MKINPKFGYLVLLLTLATTSNSLAEAKSISPSVSVAQRLANINSKLKEKQQQILQSAPEEWEAELLTYFEDFADSLPFSDFSDIPIWGPDFADFGDSLPFSDFADVW